MALTNRVLHLFRGCLRPLIWLLHVHWSPVEQVWDTKGWLSSRNASPLLESGAIDFAGGLVVHFVGGLSGFWGALILGPRIGRYVDGKLVHIPGHSTSLVVLGRYVIGVVLAKVTACCSSRVCMVRGVSRGAC